MNRSTQHAFQPEEVMAYLDGELESARAAALVGHLEHCEECQALVLQFRQLSERLLDFQIDPVPSDLNKPVFAALESMATGTTSGTKTEKIVKPRKWRLSFSSPYTRALACLLIAAFLVTFGVSDLSRFGREKRQVNYSVDTEIQPFSPYIGKLEAPLSSGAELPADRGGQAHFGPMPETPPPPPRGGGGGGGIEAPTPSGPLIAQTAWLTIVAANFDQASAAVDRLAAGQGGYIQKLATSDRIAASREFSATVRVPAAQLGGFLAELRKLGHVEQETRTNEEVTDQYVDLQARLKSARASEQRMLELLTTRTGKLEDVLDAERELARIREEIESMEGQRVLLAHRVNYATVEMQLHEEYREKLDSRSASTATKIWNAAVEGYENLEGGVIGVLLFLLSYGPAILFWLAVLLVPGWFVWRKFRSRA